MMSLRKRTAAFTLVEVMVAVAVLGLCAAGSLRLFALSARSLEAVRSGRERLTLSRTLWIRAVADDLEERGRQEEYEWETGRFDFPGQNDVPEGFFCKTLIVYPKNSTARLQGEKREKIVIYVPDFKIKKGRTQ